MYILATIYGDLGNPSIEVKLKTNIFEAAKNLLGEMHPVMLAAMYNLATP